MFGMKYFNEIKGSQPLETKLKKEIEKRNEKLNLNIEDLDKPIVFDVVKNNK